MRHGTSMKIEGNFVDSLGQSEIGVGVTRLLGFDLLPRIKRINKVKLYRPGPAAAEPYPLLGPAMTRPIRWDLIEDNYNMMVEYATAIRVGTASPKRCCAASPATPPTPSTRRCSKSAERKRPFHLPVPI